MLAAGAPTRDQGRQLFERRAGAWGDMIFPVVAILVLWFLLSRADVLPRLPTRMSAGLPEKLASIGAVLVALLLIVRGNVWAALVMFGVSLWLLGRASRLAPPAERPRRPRLSRVRSATIEMDWDHRTGRMTGRVLAGQFEGRALAALGREQCASLYQASRAADPDGARLLEAYFDRRFPGWRRAGDDHADARPRRPASSLMSEDEAYEVLGLRRGASRDEIVRSHRTVMKKWHPDQGGSADLAARANEAKEVLLRRHA